MYILFAVLSAAVVYGALLIGVRVAGQTRLPDHHLALLSLLVLAITLVLFNFASRAVGVDLGPGRAVSYNIPFDYLARGVSGALALLPYALACLAPAIAFALAQRRGRAF